MPTQTFETIDVLKELDVPFKASQFQLKYALPSYQNIAGVLHKAIMFEAALKAVYIFVEEYNQY